jgi:mono/diheme cytochrome c family protein
MTTKTHQFRRVSTQRVRGAAAFVLVALLLASGPAPAAVQGSGAGASAGAGAKDTREQIARGGYLVLVGGCGDCHTPMKMGPKGPEPDMARRLSGHPAQLKMPPPPKLGDGPWLWVGSATNTAFAGPWGISYGINLTPDAETGLGKWTEAQFVAALKTGRHLGASRPILPPMPWQSTAQMKDEDLRAIFAYLRSLPPIVNRVPDAQIAPPPVSAPGAARR